MPVSLRIAEYSVLILIIIIGIGGVAILIVGGRSGLTIWPLRSIAPRHPFFAAILLGCCGLVACILAVLGWTWICSRDVKRVTGLTVLILLLALAELCITVWCIYVWINSSREIHKELEGSLVISLTRISDKIDSNPNDVSKAWDTMQKELGCCGLSGPGDYLSRGTIPWSCCDDGKGLGPSCFKVFQNGCLQPFQNFMLSQIELIGFVAALHSLLTLTVFFCAVGLVTKLKHDVRSEGIALQDLGTLRPLNPKSTQML